MKFSYIISFLFMFTGTGGLCQQPDLGTFLFVEGGTFTMGTSGSEGYEEEQPQHKVALSEFYLGETEITQAQWRSVMGNNPSKFSGCDACPVENVSWYDVQRFIKKINKNTPGVVYRLPTEAEWEYAALGGQKSRELRFAGSNLVDTVAWYQANALEKTHPVKSKMPNELGLFDMNGNVGEWCLDWISYYKDYKQTNPTGKSSGLYKIYRGGSWNHPALNCRNKDRQKHDPDLKGDGLIGFRLVKILRP